MRAHMPALPRRSLCCLLALTSLSVSCTHKMESLEARFAREERCAEPVRIHASGPRYTAQGCGKRAEYVCKTLATTSAKTECERAGLPPPPGASLEQPTYPTRSGDQIAPGDHR